MGGCGGGNFPKLVFIVATLPCCYGNKQISFQGWTWGVLGSRLCLASSEDPQEEMSGVGNTAFLFAPFCCSTQLCAGSPLAPPIIHGV